MTHWMPSRLTFVAATLCAICIGVGCAQTQNDKVDSPYEFQRTLQNFHRDMRWSKFHEASKAATPDFRQNFLGRYEEYGDDYDIVDLEVKSVEQISIDQRRVEVDQQSVVEPDMTVNKETYVEIWERGDGGWALNDRMLKREWKRREKERNRGEESDERDSDEGKSEEATGSR